MTPHKFLFFLIAGLILFAGGCGNSASSGQEELHTYRQGGLLGTVVTVSLYGEDAEAAANQCFDAIADIDRRMSVNRPDSEISLLNQNGGRSAVSVSPDTYALIGRSLYFSGKSGGAFDVSIGAVTDLWKIDGTFARLPSLQEIETRLPLVDYRNIVTHGENSVSLARAGMIIDLGGIAKGYACDRSAQILKDSQIKSALLDLGGNVFALGGKPDGSAWRVGIKSPVIGDSSIACALEIRDKSVVTSGGYERFLEHEGVVYHHLLNPETGMSARGGLLSVTIVADSSTDADILSTACFVLGLENGMRLLQEEDTQGYEAIFITEDKQIFATAGIQRNIINISPAYTLANAR
jgi:thiamine biosynthesis lipoprotein